MSDRTVTLDAAVTVSSGSAAGKVQFRDGDTVVGAVTVATGAASLTLSNVTPGDHTYTASFVPTDPTVYVGSDSAEETVTAALIATTTALTASASGQTVTLTATPATTSGRLTGSVELPRRRRRVLGTVTLTDTTVVRDAHRRHSRIAHLHRDLRADRHDARRLDLARPDRHGGRALVRRPTWPPRSTSARSPWTRRSRPAPASRPATSSSATAPPSWAPSRSTTAPHSWS